MNKTYEIGDKVETPFGIGIIDDRYIDVADGRYLVEYPFINNDNDKKHWLTQEVIRPYKSAHDKLLEKGFKLVYNLGNKSYKLEHKEKGGYTIIDILPSNKLYSVSDNRGKPLLINAELTDIMKQYVEEI